MKFKRKQVEQYLLWFVFTLSLVAVLGAYVFEIFFKAIPCTLCYYQRYIYVFIFALALYGLIVKRVFKKRILLFLSALVFLGNAIVAAYQVLVEQKILPLPQVCRPQKVAADSFAAFKSGLLGAEKAPIPCDFISFELFGVSMAGYNTVICFIVALCLLLYLRGSKHRKF